MWARLAAFQGGDVEKLRAESEQRIAGDSPFPEGVKKALILGTADGERRLFITLFESKEALDASEQAFESMGDDIPEDVRGTRVAVEQYEVLVDWPG